LTQPILTTMPITRPKRKWIIAIFGCYEDILLGTTMATKLMSTLSCVEIKDYIIKLRYKLKTEEKKKKRGKVSSNPRCLQC
jgi:hypothetical protein